MRILSEEKDVIPASAAPVPAPAIFEVDPGWVFATVRGAKDAPRAGVRGAFVGRCCISIVRPDEVGAPGGCERAKASWEGGRIGGLAWYMGKAGVGGGGSPDVGVFGPADGGGGWGLDERPGGWGV